MTAKQVTHDSLPRSLPGRHTLLHLAVAGLFALPLAPLADDAPPAPPPQPATAPNPFLDALRNAAEQARRRQQQAPQPPGATPQPVPMPMPLGTPPAASMPLPVMPPAKKPATDAGRPQPVAKAIETKPAETKAPDVKPAEAAAPTANHTAIQPRKEVLIEQPKLDAASGVTLRFDNAEIFEVVQTVMGDILHLNYVIDPGVSGKVNINGLSPVSAEDLLGVLQSVLAFNNVSIIRDGNMYKVVRDAMVPRDSVSGAAAGNNGALVQIFAPRYIQPSAALNTLRAFVGPQAAITTDPTDHYLIVVDRAANVKKLQEILQSLDVDYLAAVQTEVVQIENGDATEVAKEMETLFKTSQLYNWKGTEANKVFFMPIKRMNAILVAAANKDVLDAAKRRIKDVDVAPQEGLNSRINIYTVKNSSADYLAGIISQIYGGAGPSSSTQRMSPLGMSGTGTTTASPTKVVEKGPVSSTTATGTGLSGEVQIIPNNKSNSLIIKAGRQDYLQILRLLEQLDTAPRQVLIQANIFEITLSKDDELGVTWKLLNNNRLHFNGNTYTTSTTLTPVATTDSSLAQGLTYGIVDGANVLAQIQAVAADSNVRVLSAPHVLASDGKEAKIELGQDVPIKTGEVTTPTTAGNTTTSTITYRTVGLLLHVRPSINESGLVNLELEQEVSDVIGTVSDTPTLSKRSVSTEVTVEDGKTIVIGGLIKNKDTKSNDGVPFLKDVPILGTLFGYQKRANERTELLLTITPYVVRSVSEAEKLSQELDAATAALRKFVAERGVGIRQALAPAPSLSVTPPLSRHPTPTQP